MFIKIFLAVVACGFTASITPAQGSKPSPTPAAMSEQERQKQEKILVDKLNSLELDSFENAPKIIMEPVSPISDADAIKRYDEATKALNEYLITGYQHRRRVFEWQLLSSRIIFLVVNALVLVGVYFSWVQFTSDRRTHLRAKAKQTPGDATEGASIREAEVAREITQIEASLQGIKVSSPVLGVVILIISFLFFYLYLRYVYPIHNVL